MTRTFLAAFIAAMALNYLGCGLVGYFADHNFDRTLDTAKATEALATVFPGSGDWTTASGSVSRGWLMRRAFITGDRSGAHFSEQVLKVGWPFTTARGFARVRSGVSETEGAILTEEDPRTGPVRYWPVQVVWPGLLINSVPLALLIGFAWLRIRS